MAETNFAARAATKMVRLGWLIGLCGTMLGSTMLGACDRNQQPETPNGQVQPIGYDQYGNPIYPQPGQPGQPPAPGYGQPPAPGYGQPPAPGYGQPPAPGYGQPPAPAAPAAPPSPLAAPCQSDLICGTHKCNIQTQRCAFPCANAATDCAPGMACTAGVCLPGLPGAAPQPK
ncbi:MAG: hypothetical protein VB934_00545 [Polyangiaceae bacterium]